MTMKTCRGHSLMELMIALAIALVMMLGLTTVLVQMKGAFVAQDQLAQLQDNERLALTVLTGSVHSAGYFPDPVSTSAAEALPAESGLYGAFAPGQSVVGENHALTVRYSAPPGDKLLVNCLGEGSTAAKPILMSTFSVSLPPQSELLCSTDGGVTTTPLVGNVTGMDVRYGTDSADSGHVDRYLSADQVKAAGLWPRVRSVQLTLTFANPLARPGEPATVVWVQTIDLMNGRGP
jgi:type IV pilus assembly protein PilW